MTCLRSQSAWILGTSLASGSHGPGLVPLVLCCPAPTWLLLGKFKFNSAMTIGKTRNEKAREKKKLRKTKGPVEER